MIVSRTMYREERPVFKFKMSLIRYGIEPFFYVEPRCAKHQLGHLLLSCEWKNEEMFGLAPLRSSGITVIPWIDGMLEQ